jgi:uncharacterized protein
MANEVVWFEVMANDAGGLRSFYGDLFDWRIADSEVPGYAFVTPEGEDAPKGGIGSAHHGHHYAIFYVAVDDPQAALDKAESLGGETVVPVTEVPNGPTIAIFKDPEGHEIGLVKTPEQ